MDKGTSDKEDQITALLQRIRNNEHEAESELLGLVYEQLHRMARREFRAERRGHTLQPTVLINELYLRIVRNTTIDWQSRAHFFTVAAETMRRILVDHARRTIAQKRPNPHQRVQLDDVFIYADDRLNDILIIDEALGKLKSWDPRQAKVVELRYFGGLSIEETARVLDVSEVTVSRDWTMARAWLSTFLNQPETTG